MAERWSPEEGVSGGFGKKTSSGRAGSSGFSGVGKDLGGGAVGSGRRSDAASLGETGAGVGGVQSKDPYVLGILQGVRPEQQRRVLQQEIERLTRESEAQHSEINQRRAEGLQDTDPKIQGRLHLIRGTDEEVRRTGGKPRVGSYNDRVLRIQTALQEPVLPDTLPYANRLFGRDVLGSAPRQARPQTQAKLPKLTTTNDVLNGVMGRDVLNTRVPNVPRVREEDIEGPNVAQLEPSIGFMQQFALPLGLSGWNASPEEMQETWEVWKQQARAGKVALPPKSTGANDERMFAQVRDLSSKFYHEVIEPRSRQRYPGTTYNVPGIGKVKGPLLPTSPEAFEAYQDPELTELYERFPEWLQGRSKQRLPRQVIQYAMALKDLAKIQRRRAGRLAVSALTDIGVQAGSAALDFPSAGVPGKGKLATELAKEAPRAGGGTGKVAAKVMQRLPGPVQKVLKSEPAQVVNRTVGPGALGRRALEGAGSQAVSDAIARPELTPDERVARVQEAAKGSAVTGTLIHGGLELGGHAWNAGKRAWSAGTAGRLQAGEVVRVPSRPELGEVTLREVKGGWAVLQVETKPGEAGAVKVRVEEVEPLRPAGKPSGGLPARAPELEAPAGKASTAGERIKQLPPLTPEGHGIRGETSPLREELRKTFRTSPDTPGGGHAEASPHAQPEAQPAARPQAGEASREAVAPARAEASSAERGAEEASRPAEAARAAEGRAGEAEPREPGPGRRSGSEGVPAEEPATRPATKDAMDLHAARQSGDPQAAERLKQGWDEARAAEAEQRLRELEEEGGKRPIRAEGGEARTRPEEGEPGRAPSSEEPVPGRGGPETGEPVRPRAGRGIPGGAPEATPAGAPRAGAETLPQRLGTGMPVAAAGPAGVPSGTTGRAGEPAGVAPASPRPGASASEGAPPGAASPTQAPSPPDPHGPAAIPTTAPENSSGAVVFSGQPGDPDGPTPSGVAPAPMSRPGPTLADQLAPGHAGVVWHATSSTAALELATGRSSPPKGGKPGLEVADRLSLARGPGGRSVVVELDPARLRGKPGPARTKPGRKYVVTGVEPDAVRALVIGNDGAFARFAADPVAAARFDFAHPVQTERGWRVERRDPAITDASAAEEHAALRQAVEKQLWRPLTERQLTGRVRDQGHSVAALPEVLAGLVQEGRVSVERGRKGTRYRVETSLSPIEAPNNHAEISPLALIKQKIREGQGKRRVVETFPDLESATRWAKTNIRGLQFVNYEGMDLDVATALTRNAFLIAHEYQVDVWAIMPHTWEGWEGKATEAFMSAGRDGISFNPELCQGIEKDIFLAGWIKSGHTSTAAKGIDAIVAHEIGHLLAENGRTSKGTRHSRETSRYIVEKYVDEFRREVGEAAIIKELSAYAWYGQGVKTGTVHPNAAHETWAQAFSAYRTAPDELSEKLSPRTVQLVETVLHELGMR